MRKLSEKYHYVGLYDEFQITHNIEKLCVLGKLYVQLAYPTPDVQSSVGLDHHWGTFAKKNFFAPQKSQNTCKNF